MLEHIITPLGKARFLERPINEIDNKIEEVIVFSSQRFNKSGLMLEQGATYKFTVAVDQTWKDASIECGPEGWNLDDVTLGLKELAIRGMQPFRRVSDADWFCLCGCINNDDYTFKIGSGAEITIEKSGEFMPFANDVKAKYGNNSGNIKVLVERLPDK